MQAGNASSKLWSVHLSPENVGIEFGTFFNCLHRSYTMEGATKLTDGSNITSFVF